MNWLAIVALRGDLRWLPSRANKTPGGAVRSIRELLSSRMSPNYLQTREFSAGGHRLSLFRPCHLVGPAKDNTRAEPRRKAATYDIYGRLQDRGLARRC